jgi:DNA-binding MarR family transcriptional regulator
MILPKNGTLNQSTVLDKSETKFYPLFESQLTEFCMILKPAELKVLLLLRAKDPYGKRSIGFRVIDIADQLGMNKGTVSRALKRLAVLQYIDLEIVEAIATLTTKSKKSLLEHDFKSTPTENKKAINSNPTDNKKALEKLSVDQSGCVQIAEVVCRQPDDLQSHTESITDLPKINKINNFKEIRSEIVDLDLKDRINKIVESKSIVPTEALPQTPNNQEAILDRDLDNFIISTREKKMGRRIENRIGFLRRLSIEDRIRWRSIYQKSLSETITNQSETITNQSETITGNFVKESFSYVELAIKMSLKRKDYDHARSILPDHLAEEIFTKYPEWRSLLRP